MSGYELKPCPVCGKDDWKDVSQMVEHVDWQNRADPEYEKSVKKAMEKKKREVFTG